jgi:hypothetical protein
MSHSWSICCGSIFHPEIFNGESLFLLLLLSVIISLANSANWERILFFYDCVPGKSLSQFLFPEHDFEYAGVESSWSRADVEIAGLEAVLPGGMTFRGNKEVRVTGSRPGKVLLHSQRYLCLSRWDFSGAMLPNFNVPAITLIVRPRSIKQVIIQWV